MTNTTISECSITTDRHFRNNTSPRIWLILGLTLLTGCMALLGRIPVASASESSLPFVRVDGRDLIDEEGSAVYLRGISFGNDVWYKSHYDIPVGHHSEIDYGRVAAMGFNSIRFYLNYQLFESDDAPFTYRESGFIWLDQNIAWARKHGMYLILNMHVPQGGHQSNGHGGRFWQEPTNQERFIALWKAIAQRYNDEPVVLGYGILNEPWPTEDIAQWEAVARKTVAAIRQEDRNHIVIVERALMVGNDFLMDNHNGDLNFVLIDDPNVMYEFHFYAPHSLTHQGTTWSPLPLENVISRYPDPGRYENTGYLIINGFGSATASLAPGTHDWAWFEGSLLTVTDATDQIGVVAAVGNNLGADGSAWFRDIRIDITDPSGTLVETKICDLRPHTFWVFMNSGTQGTGEHGAPTSQGAALHIAGTRAEAYLAGGFSLFPLQQGYTYTISGWMKGQNIPEGAEAQLVLAPLSSDGPLLPRGKEFINAAIGRFAAWAESRNAPLYLGEFGSVEWTFTQQLGGLQWVSDVLDACVARGIHYNYHSYHESGAFGLFGNAAATPVTMESVNKPLLNLFIEKQNGSLALLNALNAQHLEGINPDATIPDLIALLEDPEWKIRKNAAIALITWGPEAEPAIPVLIRALGDEEWQVRKPAAQALAAIGPAAQPAVPALIKALNDEEWHVRKPAAQALAAVGPAAHPAVPALIEALHDEEWQVRKPAVEALAAIASEDPDVLSALQMCLDDQEDQVRRAAASALKVIEALTPVFKNITMMMGNMP